MKGKWWAFIFLVSCLSQVAFGKTLVVGVHPGLSYPDYSRENGKDLGIIPALVTPFARSLDVKVEYKYVPRKRMDELMLSGEVHMRCLAAKSWVKNPSQFYWTRDIFQEVSTFVQRKEDPLIKDFSDLKGKAFAGILRFIYGPEVTKMVEQGHLERNDVIKVKNLIDMVTLKRTYAALESKRVLAELVKDRKDLTLSPLIQGRVTHHCLFSKSMPLNLRDRFNRFYTDERLARVLAPFKLP